MLLLILGLALWWAAHLFKRIAPERRAAMGKTGRGPIALLILLALVLMIIGFRQADGPYWWGATTGRVHINNVLMLVAFYLFAAAGMKTRVARRLQHPQLIGFSVWAIAHLLVNGDLPSFVLFGGLLMWALVEIVVINHSTEEIATEGDAPPLSNDLKALLAGAVVMIVVVAIHTWLGYPPFRA